MKRFLSGILMKKLIFALGVLFVFTLTSAYAQTFEIDLVDGDWVNAVPNVTINNSGINGGLSTARWGTPASGNGQSGYDFESRPTKFDVFSDGTTAFLLGDFTHVNFPITGTSLDTIDLALKVEDLGVFDVVTSFNFEHDETPNSGPNPNDFVEITNPIVNKQFTYLGQDYYFNLLGFSQDGGTTISTLFETKENQLNTAGLYAKITEAPVPEPATFVLFGIGLLSIAGVSRKK